MAEERKIVAVYQYKNEKGEVLYEVCRTEQKRFFQRRPDGKGGHIYDMSGVRRVPYRLQELVSAPMDEWIYIVEGEKDTDRIFDEGFVATTNSGGAGKWLDDYGEYFRGRLVAIIPDNDEPGRKHAEKVAASLSNFVKSVRIIDLRQTLPGLKEKGDVSDFFDAGCKRGHLSILVDNAADYVPEKKWTKKAEVVTLDKVTSKGMEYIWPKRVPSKALTLFAGDPGLGKSYLTLYLAALVSKGLALPDGGNAPLGSTVLLSVEDDLGEIIVPRLEKMGADLGKIKAIRNVLHKEEDGSITCDHFNILKDTNELKEVIDGTPGCKLVIIDPLSEYFGNADTHKDAVVRRVLAKLTDLAVRCNVAIVGIMHLSKGSFNKASYRLNGSIGFLGVARFAWGVTVDPDNPESDRRIFTLMKSNYIRKKDAPSLAFTVTQDERVVFEDKPCDISAEQAFAPQGGIEAPERKRCVEWLKEILSAGPMPSKELHELAKQEGFKEGTLRIAKKELGVSSWHEDDEQNNRKWYIALSKPENKQPMIPGLAEKIEKAKEELKNLKKRYLPPSIQDSK